MICSVESQRHFTPHHTAGTSAKDCIMYIVVYWSNAPSLSHHQSDDAFLTTHG